MADTKISALPASTTPLAGTEVLPIVQSSVTVKVSVDNLTVKNILNSEILATQDPTKTIANPSQFSNVNNRLTQGVNVGLEFSYTF
jgi:hypothetical protein